MAILSTDAAFKKKLAKLVKTDREDLWRELHAVGCFFALIGAIPEALLIWNFMYSGLVPMPDPDDRTISVFGDGAISAICYTLKEADVSKGTPAPKISGQLGNFTLAGNLKKRATVLDRWSRERITGDPGFGRRMVPNPEPEDIAAATLREARILAQPQEGEEFSRAESNAYSILTGLIADAPALELMHPCYQAAALLLAADMAARRDQIDDAIRFLHSWHDLAISWDYTVGEALGLLPVVRLICNGALAAKHKIPPKTCKELAKELIKNLTARLKKPEPKRAPRWKYKIYISYGQFYLEPLKNDRRAVYFQEDGEPEQGFSSFPEQVAFSIPGDADECRVEAAISNRLPDFDSCAQAVAVPLNVKRPGGLYIRTVDDSGKKHRLEVPAGKYDVIARFYRIEPKKTKEACFEKWRAVLTFLPAGTVSPSCIKSAQGAPPAPVFLHET